MNTIALNQYHPLITKYKWDWELGFSDGLEFDACIPEFADVSEDAYRAGYAYAMDWLNKHHNGCLIHRNLPLKGLTIFRNQTLFPVEIPHFEEKSCCYIRVRM